MNIAVIGSGISGLTCAYLLQQHHKVSVFEKAKRIGGHTATVDVAYKGEQYSIDTGFIVYNDWTYPNFIKLLGRLGVDNIATEMSFSVSCKHSGLEYGGSNLNTLFAQRSNFFNLGFINMLRNILRFNREAIADLDSGNLEATLTLGEYLQGRGYSKLFISHYLIPMGSAIWSSTLQEMLDFPLVFFVRFFKNHGLLSVTDRPQWRVIRGGSNSYLGPLTESLTGSIAVGVDIEKVVRQDDGVKLVFTDGSEQAFDQVVFACHSDQALSLLADPSDDEKDILGAIPYRENKVVLHTDIDLLPRAKGAWSAWNYHLDEDKSKPATLSYNMNILQGIEAEDTFVVSLNAGGRIKQDSILGEYHYAHPVFTLEGMLAQQRWQDINGVRRSWFCGAYWRNGFHEDGCTSGIRVATALGATWQ